MKTEVPKCVQGTYPVIINETDGNATKRAGLVLNVTSESRPHDHPEEFPMITILFLAFVSFFIVPSLATAILAIRNRRDRQAGAISGPFSPDGEKEEHDYMPWGDADQ